MFSSAHRIFQHGWWWRTWLFTPPFHLLHPRWWGNSLRRPPSHPSDNTIMPLAPLCPHMWTRVFHPEQKLHYSLEWVPHLELDFEPRTMAWDFELLTFFCAATLTAANHPDVSWRSQRKPTETNQSRSITPRPSERTPASLWLCLKIKFLVHSAHQRADKLHWYPNQDCSHAPSLSLQSTCYYLNTVTAHSRKEPSLAANCHRYLLQAASGTSASSRDGGGASLL